MVSFCDLLPWHLAALRLVALLVCKANVVADEAPAAAARDNVVSGDREWIIVGDSEIELF